MKKKKTKKKLKKIIIVESPTKSKTIKGFVGNDFTLLSSRGHIKDLPKSKLGVDIENNFKPYYIKIRGKASIINEIKKACKDAPEVYLAPDPDREGEAIAQHLAEELNSTAPKIKRALFYEITPEHVNRALQHPTTINLSLVDAHKARRVLDRIVGYYTSPILWKILKSGLSAGRVQTVALRLICEREKEIAEFKPTPYWTAEAEFETPKGERFRGTLWRIGGEIRKINTKDELDKLTTTLQKGISFNVVSFRVTHPQRTPPPPFITSTLQQEASRRLRFSARKTMFVAQGLYEGIKLPEGSIGLITYMRTDSTRVNAEALAALRKYIAEKYGTDYLNEKLRTFKDRKNVQAGHEAIRPTKMYLEPEIIKDHLTPDQHKLYGLIFRRFVASQMSPAQYRQKEAVVRHDDIDFKSEELRNVFPGYQRLSGDIAERGSLSDLSEGETVSLSEITFTEKSTEPAPRYTEARLIRKLEENGIGRPSTYAHIINTLADRGYTSKERGRIKATELGMQVYDIIIPRFDTIFEVSFTAKMEAELDSIESGEKEWQDVVRDFYEPFAVKLDKTKKEVAEIKESITETVDKKCPKCGKPLIVKWGRYGKFLACSGFPDCRYSENLDVEKTGKTCPHCGKELIVKFGRFGKFLACSGYPDCRYTENIGHDAPCPLCGGNVIIITTRRGKIYKCKKCTFSAFYPPIEEKCKKCGRGMVMKKGRPACPVCDGIIKKKKKK
ncbi:hypothetical protein AMJ87_09695 [candidate division WOR_3 bacterium SM23_60]|uniref:DNA topoisomerase 1 n=1 Tax=candidate division WOR_3 bacterium SM23_60 TaxID=1703780 RepID=A0A0S8GEA3_UNCW3|nr:MAG: hypothetical protein AMJ87_09695 [candidate division WOR_3 bacterium SM23_60]